MSARNTDLEAAINAAPEKDAPWLVYADWFESEGERRHALALRALGGAMDESSEAKEASMLAVAVAGWLSGREPHGDWDDFPEPTDAHQVRNARRTRGFLRVFLAAWGKTSPFTVESTAAIALTTHSVIDEALEVPEGAELVDASFEHVPVNQNGTIGIAGAFLVGTCTATTAFDLLAAHVLGVDPEELRGEERTEVFEDAIEWKGLSRASALQMLFSTEAQNDGHRLKRGEREVPLVELFDEVGWPLDAAVSQSEFSYTLVQLERGWLLFYVTY